MRNPRGLEGLIDAKVLYGFRVLSTTGSLRLDNDSDIAIARVLVAMANKSSADTARSVARASKQQTIDDKWHGGRASRRSTRPSHDGPDAGHRVGARVARQETRRLDHTTAQAVEAMRGLTADGPVRLVTDELDRLTHEAE